MSKTVTDSLTVNGKRFHAGTKSINIIEVLKQKKFKINGKLVEKYEIDGNDIIIEKKRYAVDKLVGIAEVNNRKY